MIRLMKLVVFLALVVPCPVQAAAEQPRVLPGKKLVLPPNLAAALQTQLPDYRLPVREDYRIRTKADSAYAVQVRRKPDYFETWNGTPDTVLPFICWGDFNGDSLTDTALLLLSSMKQPDSIPARRAHGETGSIVLAVLLQTNNGYEVQFPMKDFLTALEISDIHTEPPGLIEAVHDTPSDSSRFDYIEWVNWAGSARAFYWKDGKWRDIWTGD
jgi:hypothetical protein